MDPWGPLLGLHWFSKSNINDIAFFYDKNSIMHEEIIDINTEESDWNQSPTSLVSKSI